MRCTIQGFRRAQEERPGAVLLELPEDVAAEPADEPIFSSSDRAYATATPEVIARAAEAIRAAKMPLLLVGAGANRKHARKALRDFVDMTGMPFFTTQMGKGVIDERNPLCLGTAALSEGDYLHCAIDRAPQRIVSDLRSVMGNTDMVALDNGIYKIWFARNYKAYAPNTVLLDNALATMGAGLPSAMMAAMLYPERRVVAVCGDGGFMMNSQELETALRLELDLVVLILNDSAYGMIRWKQVASGLHDWGLGFNNPDFIQYAQSYGATGHRVTTAGELAPTVEAAFAAGGVHVIDVPVDYSENQRVLVDELAAKACLL